jgi:hypothetical protein
MTGEVRTFKSRITPIWLIMLTIAGFGMFFWPITFGYLILTSPLSDPKFMRLWGGPYRVYGMTAFYFAAAVYFVFILFRNYILEALRGSVSINDSSLLINNWRNQRQEVQLSSIEEVRVIDWSTPKHINIKANGEIIKIAPLVEKPDDLLAEIISRAWLVESRSNWHSTWYGRPEGQTDVERG